jgi:hypothetical protein
LSQQIATEQSSNSSSARTQATEEFYSPERERAPSREVQEDSGKVLEEDDEDKLPVYGDYHLKDLIDLRIKQIQLERGEEFTPIDEVETRKIKLTKKSQTIFEIPLPTKDPELVEEIIKVLIGHIESKMNTKIDRLHSLKGQPKIFEDYDELNRRLQQWYIECSQ